MTFLSRKSMITRSSIAFEDFLGSSIAPQVMPPCRRPIFDKYGSVIIRSFNHHLRATKRVALERGSDILGEILFLPDKGDSVTPFFKILNEVHYDTAPFRQRDNRNFCFISDYRKKLTRAQNFKRNQHTSKTDFNQQRL